MLRADYSIDGKFTVQAVVDLLGRFDARSLWDSHMVQASLVKQMTKNVAVYAYLYRNPQLFEKDREFVVKCIVFREGDAVYMYVSAVADAWVDHDPHNVRAATIAALYLIRRKGDKITVMSSQQNDYKFLSSNSGMYPKLAEQMFQMRTELVAALEKRA